MGLQLPHAALLGLGEGQQHPVVSLTIEGPWGLPSSGNKGCRSHRPIEQGENKGVRAMNFLSKAVAEIQRLLENQNKTEKREREIETRPT